MTVSYFVRYEVEAPDEFIRHYQDKHVPVLARWPGMRQFESQADLDRALGSPERLEARRDFEAFPAFEGEVLHQAMNSEEVWRKP